MDAIKIITVQQMRELEQKANAGGLSYATMMENAGRCTAQAVLQRRSTENRCVVLLIGPGNNGGDGLVAAHYLREAGVPVCCYIWKREAKEDANLQRVEQDGASIIWCEDDTDLEALRGLLSGAEVVVDALLGIGVSRPIGGTLGDLLDATRQALADRVALSELIEIVPGDTRGAAPLVVAVDCPSGLDCDSGALDPAALHADLTVTFGHPKVGLLRFPGAEAVGELVVADIGIPAELVAEFPLEMATPHRIASWLPDRPRSAHKGTCGSALIVAGSVNYVGAAALSGAGAYRVGTGLVTLALPTPIQSAVAAILTEATYLLLPHDMGVINAAAVGVLEEKLGDYGALLVGPGLTDEKEAVAFVHALLGLEPDRRKGHIGFLANQGGGRSRPALPPLVIDADGLNALARHDQWWQALPSETILTPHPGEMARLMGGEITTREIQTDREGLARRMAQDWNAVLVLKGAFTVIAAPDGRVTVLPFANPGLATAGSGDVLAGAIVGLRAQGMGAYEAAVAGGYLHAAAGEIARREMGCMGTVAGDLLPRLPQALQRIRRLALGNLAPIRR